jgi:putative thioredoxin
MSETNAGSPDILHTTDATFQEDVIQRSHELPVVVDFWAEWCQPCRMLAPILDKLAEEFAGRFLLVKADTDATPQAASAFQVQGIPAVFAVFQGELIDAFQGLLPEPQLRSWLERIVLRGDLHRARQLETSAPEQARAIYTRIQSDHPHLADAAWGEARTWLAQNQPEKAQAILERLEGRGFLEPDGQKIKAALELGEKRTTDLDKLQAQAAAEPHNLELQLELGQALAAHEQHEAALQTLLGIIARQKTGVGDRARELMIDIFRVLPEDSELTGTYRRQLASLLY